MTRIPFTPKQRFEVLIRDQRACQYCGARAPNVQLVVDHVIPVSHGGTNDFSNLVTACFSCNAGKGSAHVHEFKVNKMVWDVVGSLPSRIVENEFRQTWTREAVKAMLDFDRGWSLLNDLRIRQWSTWDHWYGHCCALLSAYYAELARSSWPAFVDERLDIIPGEEFPPETSSPSEAN